MAARLEKALPFRMRPGRNESSRALKCRAIFTPSPRYGQNPSAPIVGIRVKLRKCISALKARSSKAQGASPGTGTNRNRALKGRSSCVAPSGLFLFVIPTQGFGCFAASTLGFAASRFQRFAQWLNLTRMPQKGLIATDKRCSIHNEYLYFLIVIGS